MDCMVLTIFCSILMCYLDSFDTSCLGLWVRNFTFLNGILFLFFAFICCSCLPHSVVEFKDEEFVNKAVLAMNKHDLNGRRLNIKEVS